jgi:hypothetical protein
MGRLSTSTRRELVAAASRRYLDANREERGRILDELTSLTGLHRKHAARLLRGGGGRARHDSRPQRRIYDDAVREALVVIWEASDSRAPLVARAPHHNPTVVRLAWRRAVSGPVGAAGARVGGGPAGRGRGGWGWGSSRARRGGRARAPPPAAVSKCVIARA